jgi:hypothetical protein
VRSEALTLVLNRPTDEIWTLDLYIFQGRI